MCIRDSLGITQSVDGWGWDDIGHVTLDVLGMVPVVGNAADGINATWYAAEGEWLDAALSSMALIPGIGQAVTLAKANVKAALRHVPLNSLDEALVAVRELLESWGLLRRGTDANGVMFSQAVTRTNAEALANGTAVPFSESSVRSIAEQAGVGLDGVNIQLLSTSDEIGYLDSMGAGAFASDGTIFLGPSVFDDPELLALTLGHERTHIFQQATGMANSSSLADLEAAAYGSEQQYIDYFRGNS